MGIIRNELTGTEGIAQYQRKAAPTPTILKSAVHPKADEICQRVEQYFLDNFQFHDEIAKNTFLAQQLPQLACLYCALGTAGRVEYACKLIVILFLANDVLNHLNLVTGKPIVTRLIRLAKGLDMPSNTVPLEYIIYDVCKGIRGYDEILAEDVLDNLWDCMKAKVDRRRLQKMDLEAYFQFRERDIGAQFLTSLMAFTMGLPLTKLATEAVHTFYAADILANHAKHMLLVNDICSYDKEVRAGRIGGECGRLFNAVDVAGSTTNWDPIQVKDVLWSMCRMCEVENRRLVAEAKQNNISADMGKFLDGLEFQMSGNEMWSLTTTRYDELGVESCLARLVNYTI